MAKKHRMIDVEVWKKQWFRKLKPVDKAYYFYLISQCDHAGIYSHDPDVEDMLLGEKPSGIDVFNVKDFPVLDIDDNNWLLLGFLSLQYPKGINGTSIPIFSVRKLLYEYQLTERVRQGLGKGFLTLKDKEIEEDINTYNETGKVLRKEKYIGNELDAVKGKETVKELDVDEEKNKDIQF